ncbi:ribosome maturation factor RimP [Ectothiorhodosinus mongolicus]|uniref:Ribosome maturation factor RimP n=1 Tax=Ectothiorhodosinus mongolicus TaxID=233100 RepID=A0A1R3VNP7_9GAMM|nr:ribosome maturation factor RimP [Ectothiorhodosinus mongolicus]ULX56519.1 ribosome maturation factor RimP [Ectothiorhodosinus mongolicus]SIT66200.1 ribosome maturation factor RimP [Ectothiorhodosinus mongolicus]
MRQDSAKIQGLIAPVIQAMGFDLWGLEYQLHGNSALLRVFIDADAGVTLDDCAAVSDQVSGVLDVEDPIPVAYRLEVSSPGVNRPLFEAGHYARYQGEKIKLRTQWPVEGRRNFSGVIQKADPDVVELLVDDELIQVPLQAVARARLLGELEVRKSRS